MEQNITRDNVMLVGVCALVNAYGLRFMWDDVQLLQREWGVGSHVRRLVVFAVFFTATRHIAASVLLFVLYTVTIKYLKRRRHAEADIFH